MKNLKKQIDFIPSLNFYGEDDITNLSSKFKDAIDEYKNICIKGHLPTSNIFISILKSDNLILYLDLFSEKEITTINKIIGAHHYFKSISLAIHDPNKTTSNKISKDYDKLMEKRDQRKKDQENIKKLYTIVQ